MVETQAFRGRALDRFSMAHESKGLQCYDRAVAEQC
jgi:hypothetical protein